MGWSLMGAGSEWIFPSLNEPIRPLLESTWVVPHMVVVVAVVAAVVAAAVVVAAVVHHGVPQGTMTGAMTEVMTEVMIVTMIAMTTESTDHTDADLRLLTIAEGTAHDPDHGPTRHVTTEQGGGSHQQFQFYCRDARLLIFDFFFFYLDQIMYVIC